MNLRSLLRAVACATAVASLAAGCGGGSSDSAETTSAAPMLATGTAAVTVVVPSGVAVTPDKLVVETSLGRAAPSTSGAATVPVYTDNGTQLAIVLGPDGHAMMMGWVDATHTTVSAATTADVFAYVALGGPTLASRHDAEQLIAAIPSAPGIGALESAVQAALASNVDAFSGANPDVRAAIAAFAAPLYASARAGSDRAARAHADGILVEAPTTQSGITALQDPPYAAHLSNAYRRRGYAYVDRVSHTIAGATSADVAHVTDFDVDPVVGVNGGVTGAIADIMNAYYGNQATAFAPTTSPSGGTFPVALVDGTDKTTYQVTVVGAGANAGVESSLTSAQQAKLTDVAVRSLVKDFVVPTFGNLFLGSGFLDFSGGNDAGRARYLAALLTAASSDIVNFTATVPGLTDKVRDGDWYGAMVDIGNTAGGSAVIRQLLIDASREAAGAAFDPSALTSFLGHLDEVLNRAGGLLQVFDSSAYLFDLAAADRADVFTIDVTATKVTLSPATARIGRGGTVVLTANVVGVDDLRGASFHWHTTTTFGDLLEVAGGGRIHQSDYCSSTPQAVFTYETNAADGSTDTVTVEAFPGASCDASRGAAFGHASATMTYSNQPVTETGSLYIDQRVIDTSDDFIVYLIEVQFADVPGATSYTVHGEGPYDPVYWGSSFNLTYNPANPPQGYFGALDHAVGLSGGTGGGIESGIAADAARFNGWTFTVTANFN